jgi:hypothetical protein
LILVSVNTTYHAHKLSNALRLAGVRVLVMSTKFKASYYVAVLTEIIPSLSGAGSVALFDPSLRGLRYFVAFVDGGGVRLTVSD